MTNKKTIFKKEFSKNPLIKIWVTLRYVENLKGKDKYNKKMIKKGTLLKVCFTPPHASIRFNGYSVDDGSLMGKTTKIYELVSIDKIEIKI